jgi:hypothetical protein
MPWCAKEFAETASIVFKGRRSHRSSAPDSAHLSSAGGATQERLGPSSWAVFTGRIVPLGRASEGGSQAEGH